MPASGLESQWGNALERRPGLEWAYRNARPAGVAAILRGRLETRLKRVELD